MSQFDVHRTSGRLAKAFPYLVEVQSDLLHVAMRCVVVPLVPQALLESSIPRFQPVFELQGVSLVLAPLDIFSAPPRLLGPVVASLAHERERIVAALDLLFTGV